MLFHLLWDQNTGQLEPWPEVLFPMRPYSSVAAGPEDFPAASRLWVLQPALPWVFFAGLESEPTQDKVTRQLRKAARKRKLTLPAVRWEALQTTVRVWTEDALPGAPPQEEDPGKRNGHLKLLRGTLAGRQIADSELPRLARELGLSEEKLIAFLQSEVEIRRGSWIAAIGPGGTPRGRTPGSNYCRRCGGNDLTPWPGVYGQMLSCRECTALGALSSLNVLWRSAGEQREWSMAPPDTTVTWSFALSPAQQTASDELERQKEKKQILIWAACGAGKTEVCFERISQALATGQRVLFAAPRQDVVHDLEPRLRQAFPGISLLVLSGAIERRFGSSSLVLATTHQVLRFFEAFDLIILDEIDAFPYSDEPLLRRGLKQALASDGRFIYLTATPSREMLGQAAEGFYGLVRLPARHHRRALPVPVWRKISLPAYQKDSHATTGGWREAFQALLTELSQAGPVLLFVPRVAQVEPWVAAVRLLFPQTSVEGSWGHDPDRRRKVEALLGGAYTIFVTTTILERGVTLRGAQVAVLYADHPLFDERTLVQMAGRAGRRKEAPNGNVVFLSEQCSPAMRAAVYWIEEQNSQARKLGLIDQD